MGRRGILSAFLSDAQVLDAIEPFKFGNGYRLESDRDFVLATRR